jgi:hypothetical protein
MYTYRMSAIAAISLLAMAPLAACPVGAAATASASTASASTVSASPGLSPSPWHVVKQVGFFNGPEVNFAAASARDAWSTWVTTASGQGSAPTVPQAVERWNGTTWQRITVPASIAPHVRTAVSVATDSPDDAWIFSWKWPAEALRYESGRWSLAAIPSWVIRPAADKQVSVSSAAFSPKDVWVFSLGIDGHKDHYAAHYDGKTWSRVTLPAIPGEVSVVSASDIWALGITGGSADSSWTASGVMHYNGHAWSFTRLLALPVAKGVSVTYANLTATGPGSTWLIRTLTASNGVSTPTVMRLSGTTWTTVSFPASALGTLIPLATAQDGSGGLWVDAIFTNPSGFTYTFHLSGGKWTESFHGYPMAWIPGTHQDWAWDPMGTIYRN